ncbi:oxidoreductase [Capnocytophaga cynodegmi]|uniref:phage antirepressor KilAC domain-containing protein n=1 Tax=Capnocytophaga cynodegmi TaxID=28189 RepID=UPI001AC52BFC|nr:phage antirepressor KilAC domain-containing protein [Capnocytophaga cynodegmi]GIM52000.1 oxidoreductase [Capnocytophaga cynodegmi]
MNELIKITEQNGQTMSSREIAELTGKRHDNVLRDCDKLNEHYENLALPKIEEGYYIHPSTGNQQHREFRLTKLQTFDLMTGYNTELRIKVNRRWAELEAKEQNQIPQSFSEALKLAYEQSLKIEEQQKQLQIQAPKVIFADAVSTSKTSILVGEMAKILKQNGIDIGQNRFFEWLRNNGYLITRNGSDFNMPTQKSMDLGLFEIKETSITHSDGHISVNKTPKVTGKGQVYFVNKFLKKVA